MTAPVAVARRRGALRRGSGARQAAGRRGRWSGRAGQGSVGVVRIFLEARRFARHPALEHDAEPGARRRRRRCIASQDQQQREWLEDERDAHRGADEGREAERIAEATPNRPSAEARRRQERGDGRGPCSAIVRRTVWRLVSPSVRRWATSWRPGEAGDRASAAASAERRIGGRHERGDRGSVARTAFVTGWRASAAAVSAWLVTRPTGRPPRRPRGSRRRDVSGARTSE